MENVFGAHASSPKFNDHSRQGDYNNAFVDKY
jgi:hypothetical protein